MSKPVIIVGGGLAGLTLGIGLRQRDIPVEIWETGSYPRHRVCGEFISGRGQSVLERLGISPVLFGCGARQATTAAFFTADAPPSNYTRVLALPDPAICISREQLDAALAQEFSRLGGVLHLNQRWSQQSGEGLLWASGRRITGKSGASRWIGIKAHVCNAHLAADLETHFGLDGYVGLCRLNGSVTNVCALVRTEGPIPDLAKTWQARLSGTEHSVLHSRMAKAQFIPGSFCATAGFSLTRHKAVRTQELRIGDALTMIPPFTGNGMSMAFEAAEIALEPLTSYSRGETDWAKTVDVVNTHLDSAFSRRLWFSALLHRAVFHRRVTQALIAAATSCPPLWRLLFKWTR